MTKLKCFVCLVSALCLAGCISPQPEPQKRNYGNSQNDVMVRDIFDIAPTTNKKLGKAVFIELFSGLKGDIKNKFSMTLVTIPAGKGIALHSLKSAEIIYVVNGGGMLKVNGIAIILREGKAVYIPPNSKQMTVNDNKKALKFITLISPPYQQSLEKILGKPPKPIVEPKGVKSTNTQPAGTQINGKKIPEKIIITTGDIPSMDAPRESPPKKGILTPVEPKAQIKTVEDSVNQDQSVQQTIKKETAKLIPPGTGTVKKVNIKKLQKLTPQEQSVPDTSNN